MEISIIICTCNRGRILSETLRSLEYINVPEDLNCEIIIVDNASSDDTSSVIDSAKLSQFSLRHVYEPKRGQCHARNSGISEARGEVLLWTDDDVRPSQNWIEGMCRPILHGVADATTGEIHIAPDLLKRCSSKAHRARMMEIGDLSEQHASSPFLIGANMAFRRHVLAKVPSFDVALGPGALGFMDDTLFCLQLVKAGYRAQFVAGCSVEHHFDPDRLSRESLLKEAKKHAESIAYVMHHWSHSTIEHRRLRMMLNAFRLLITRLKNPLLLTRADIYSDREYDYAFRYHLYKSLLLESSEPRQYKFEALVKKS